MGFPITVNGRTWNLADFQNGQHHENLGQFLYDCMTDFPKRFVGTSTTSVSTGTGSKTFTSQTGKGWKVGQRLAVFFRSPSTGESFFQTSYMNGVVTAYNSGTGSLTINVDQFYGSGTIASWNIMPGSRAITAATPIAFGNGGTGVTTVAAAKGVLGIPTRDTSIAPLIEDFLGYFPTVTSLNPGQVPGLTMQAVGAARILSGGNAVANLSGINESKEAGVTDGAHPGIAVMEVGAFGDIAEIAFVNAPVLLLGDDAEFVVHFFMPIDNSLTEKIQIAMGFVIPENWQATLSGARTYAGFAMHYPGFGEAPTADVDVSVSGSESEQGGYAPVYPGRWHTLHFGSNGSDFWGELYYEDPTTGNMVMSTDWLLGMPAQTAGNTYWPFIRFAKRSGTAKRTLLVDYVYLKRGVTRT